MNNGHTYGNNITVSNVPKQQPYCEQWSYGNNFSVSNVHMVTPLVSISARADLGPRSRVCAPETLRSAPIDTSGNCSAHMSGGGKLSDSFSDQLSRQIREF